MISQITAVSYVNNNNNKTLKPYNLLHCFIMYKLLLDYQTDGLAFYKNSLEENNYGMLQCMVYIHILPRSTAHRDTAYWHVLYVL